MMATTGLGLLTSETTLERAAKINNDFQLLWRDSRVQPKLRKELDVIMSGWVDYYNRLKNSYWSRMTEYGELSWWERKYNQFRNKVQAAGVKVTAPPLAVSKVPGDVQLKPPTEEELQKIEEQAKKVGTMLIAGASVAALGVGWILWRMGRK